MIRLLPLMLSPLLSIAVGASAHGEDHVSLLIKALDDKNIRQGASIALAKLGGTAVPALREALLSDSPDVQVWSAYTLGNIGSTAKPALGDLTRALSSSDHSLRVAAVQALGKIGEPETVAALSIALTDDDKDVRCEAAIALGKISSPSRTATALLIAALSDPDVRPGAREALVRIGTSTVDTLVDSLSDQSIRFDVAAVLREIDPEMARQLRLDKPTLADLPSLRLSLHDETRPPDERSLAALSLAGLGDDGVVVLVAAFEDPPIARTAAEAFACAGPSSVSSLVDALTHRQSLVRGTAADALGHIGHAASDATPDLILALKDQDRDVRYRVVRALHEFGQKAKPAVPALTEVILNSSELEPTRQWAIKTLVVTLPKTHDAVVKALIEASKEETNYGVRQLARQQLFQIDRQAAEAAGIK